MILREPELTRYAVTATFEVGMDIEADVSAGGMDAVRARREEISKEVGRAIEALSESGFEGALIGIRALMEQAPETARK